MVASARPDCGDRADDIAELHDISKEGYFAVASATTTSPPTYHGDSPSDPRLPGMTARSHILKQWWPAPSSSGLTRGSIGTVTGGNFRDRCAQSPVQLQGPPGTAQVQLPETPGTVTESNFEERFEPAPKATSKTAWQSSDGNFKLPMM